MKTYEELARMKVQEAIQAGIRAQRVDRELRAGAGERKIRVPDLSFVLRSMWRNFPRPSARRVPEPDRNPAARGPEQVA